MMQVVSVETLSIFMDEPLEWSKWARSLRRENIRRASDRDIALCGSTVLDLMRDMNVNMHSYLAAVIEKENDGLCREHIYYCATYCAGGASPSMTSLYECKM